MEGMKKIKFENEFIKYWPREWENHGSNEERVIVEKAWSLEYDIDIELITDYGIHVVMPLTMIDGRKTNINLLEYI